MKNPNETLSNLTSTSPPEDPLGFKIWTWILLLLTIFSMGFNFWMFKYIGKHFPSSQTLFGKRFPPIAIYLTQRIDCLVTSVSQIGALTLLIGSLSKTPNEHVCAIGQGIGLFMVMQPIVTCLFLAILRYLKLQTTFEGQTFPSVKSLMIMYGISSFLVFVYCISLAIFNHTEQLHMLLAHEFCLKSNIPVDLVNLFFYFILPLIVIFALNFFVDSNYWLKPYFENVNLTDIYSAILNQASIKTSTLTFVILLIFALICVLPQLQLSNQAQCLVALSLCSPLLVVKGPCMLYWTIQVDDHNLQEAKHNLMVLELNLQYKKTNDQKNQNTHLLVKI